MLSWVVILGLAIGSPLMYVVAGYSREQAVVAVRPESRLDPLPLQQPLAELVP